MHTYVATVLKEIKLIKERFVLDLELGDELVVPKEFSLDKMSLNYRFYDPTLAFVHENLSKQMRNFFILKNQQNVKRNQDDSNLKGKLTELIGFKNSAHSADKRFSSPVFKRSLSTFQELHEIDPIKSSSCACIQNSKYLVVDSDM